MEVGHVGCLAGVRVIECGRLAAVPFCGKLLAGLGAEVIKVEPPLTGDPARRRPPFAGDQPGLERSLLFLFLNGGKASVTLNLTTTTGRGLLLELLRHADVFIHDFQPSETERLGLDYSTIGPLFPRLIVASLTPFGSTGPYREYKAYDLNVYMVGGDGYLMPSGLAHELFPEREPIKMPGFAADYACGLGMAIGVLAALMAREITGQGQFLDLSKQEIQVSMSREQIMWYVNENVLETRDTRAMNVGGCFRCRDGYVQIYVFSDEHWRGLVRLMGNPAWAEDQRFQTPRSRAEHGSEINHRIQEWAINLPKDEIYRRGQAVGATVGAFYTPADVLADPHEQERGFFVEVEHPDVGRIVQPGWPFQPSATPPVSRPAPRLGQDTERILGRLGILREELVQLRRCGII